MDEKLETEKKIHILFRCHIGPKRAQNPGGNKSSNVICQNCQKSQKVVEEVTGDCTGGMDGLSVWLVFVRWGLLCWYYPIWGQADSPASPSCPLRGTGPVPTCLFPLARVFSIFWAKD